MTPSEGNAPLPELHNTVVVAAFEGWNDAGDAASDAVAHLAASWQALPIVEIDDEAYYDYQVNRPVIRQVDGVTRELQWPAMRISHCRPPGSDRDVVLMCGVEPNMRWRTFCDELLAVIDKLNVDTVVILGALLDVGGLGAGIRACRAREGLHDLLVKRRRLSAQRLIGLRVAAKQRRHGGGHLIGTGGQHTRRGGRGRSIGRADRRADACQIRRRRAQHFRLCKQKRHDRPPESCGYEQTCRDRAA